ncbi:MAG: hypothetical protein HQM10_20945 [Candidatus Riflebacteria bacterium]|nr:hypothetical protein [Candidatus Riflebacteria bacterium]
MNRIILLARKPHFPLTVMVIFFFILCAALGLRVYYIDSEIASRQIAETQSLMAAHAGIHFGITKIRQAIEKSGESKPSIMEELLSPRWRNAGVYTDSYFRILEVRPLPGADNPETPLIDESSLYRIESEGRSAGHSSRVWGTVSVVPVARRFAVFNSLNEYYYGKPITPWIQEFKTLENFRKENFSLFQNNTINNFGICHDPEFIVKLYKPGEADPFNPPKGGSKLKGNYGSMYYSRDGISPCNGPLYCETSIIVDNHQFFGPVQTASYLYRRSASRPSMKIGDIIHAIPSSRRIQKIVDNLEADLPEGPFIDADTVPKTAFMAKWRPDYEVLRGKAIKDGLYIDSTGKGFLRGQKIDTDFHLEAKQIYSDTYLTSNESQLRQDEMSGGVITLSTPNKFQGINNISADILKGSSILFSENSLSIRGEIGNDLTMVTPGHIFITGSVNSENSHNLLMIAGNGIAIDTSDLENFIQDQKPSQETLSSVSKWTIKAVLYRPGAGCYGNWARRQVDNKEVLIPVSAARGERVSIQIVGATVDGNLQRWVDYQAFDGLKVDWKPNSVDRLSFVPVSVNLLKIRTLPNY